MPDKTDWVEQIKRYSDELRRLHEKSDLPAPPAVTPAPENEPKPIPAPATAEQEEPPTVLSPAPARQTVPTPPFGDSTDGTAQTDTERAASQAAETDIGTLIVRLQSARGTIPIVGATVMVFRQSVEGDRLIYMGETDENGESPEWALPTLDRNLSLEPGVAVPYVNYAVQANAVGYAAYLNEGVSIFGGIQTLQRIFMLPLPEPASALEETLLVTRPQNPLSELN